MALLKLDTAAYGMPCLALTLKGLKCETLVELQTRVFRQHILISFMGFERECPVGRSPPLPRKGFA